MVIFTRARYSGTMVLHRRVNSWGWPTLGDIYRQFRVVFSVGQMSVQWRGIGI